MPTKHLFVLTHIRNKGEVGTLYHKTSLSPPEIFFFYLLFQGGVSFVDPFCYLCFVSVMLSCLFFAALWSSAGKGLVSWLSCV